LKKLISDNAPGSFRKHALESYFGRKVAVDASMHMYQFMAVVGRQGDQLLTDENGEVTSHLQGMMHRTARLLDAGIKPVYVFDGKPPEMKLGELTKRKASRQQAEQEVKAAKERGDDAAVEKMAKRTIRVTREQNEECKKLLRLMGVPILEAPCEAEAQCAELCKGGKVYTVATEDMDCLTFATTKQSRNMMAPASQKKEIEEFDVAKVIEGLEVSMDQFIDICILCGCDYCGSIKGIGPKRSLELIRKHGSIENVVTQLDPKKYTIPEPFPYKEARALFKQPDVIPAAEVPQFVWKAPDEEGMIQFMVTEKGFNEDRVKSVIKKVKESKKKSTQGRLESFFGAVQYRPAAKAVKKETKPKQKGGLFGKSTGVTKKKSSGIRLG